MRYFWVQTVLSSGTGASLRGGEARHMHTVLRLQPGDRIGLCDGRGQLYEARIERLTPTRADVAVQRRLPLKTESSLRLTVAQALLKERKMDGLLRQMTELGVTAWLPYVCERSVPQPPPARMAARQPRWLKIAREALKQCGRGRLPAIEPLVDFAGALDYGAGFDLKLIFWEEHATLVGQKPPELPLAGTGKSKVRSAFIMLGPEGGFAAGEVDRARAAGFAVAGLGPRILRAETAAVAAATLVQYLYGDLGPKKS